MFSLENICPKLWSLKFSTLYDMTLHFFRYNEYTSDKPNEKLELVDVIEKYSKTYGEGSFTYAQDHLGFTIPASSVFSLHRVGIPDINRYDDLMLALCKFIKSKEDGVDFYLIGTSDEDTNWDTTFSHELAHGLYYTNSDYKAEMENLVNEIPARTRGFLFKKLKEYNYPEYELSNEAQAYLSTGLIPDFKSKGTTKAAPKFGRVFKKFANPYLKKRKKS